MCPTLRGITLPISPNFFSLSLNRCTWILAFVILLVEISSPAVRLSLLPRKTGILIVAWRDRSKSCTVKPLSTSNTSPGSIWFSRFRLFCISLIGSFALSLPFESHYFKWYLAGPRNVNNVSNFSGKSPVKNFVVCLFFRTTLGYNMLTRFEMHSSLSWTTD